MKNDVLYSLRGNQSLFNKLLTPISKKFYHNFQAYPADSTHEGRISDSPSDYPTIKESDYPLPVCALELLKLISPVNLEPFIYF